MHDGENAQVSSVVASLGREQSMYDGEIPGGRPKQKLCPKKTMLETKGAREGTRHTEHVSNTNNCQKTRLRL
jgi:hypothetical protein